MSITDDIEKLIAASPQNQTKEIPKNQQLEKLEEVEEALLKLGVSLEPKFEISLNSRCGLYHKHQQTVL
mgnify:CR=1 FL=1